MAIIQTISIYPFWTNFSPIFPPGSWFSCVPGAGAGGHSRTLHGLANSSELAGLCSSAIYNSIFWTTKSFYCPATPHEPARTRASSAVSPSRFTDPFWLCIISGIQNNPTNISVFDRIQPFQACIISCKQNCCNLFSRGFLDCRIQIWCRNFRFPENSRWTNF